MQKNFTEELTQKMKQRGRPADFRSHSYYARPDASGPQFHPILEFCETLAINFSHSGLSDSYFIAR